MRCDPSVLRENSWNFSAGRGDEVPGPSKIMASTIHEASVDAGTLGIHMGYDGIYL